MCSCSAAWPCIQGKIAEMATGEGKTLVATMPVYLNALTGRGVHVVTVNDYLAARDSEWMGAVYKLAGADGGLHPARSIPRRCAASSTPATSLTAPTPSSASITCATTAWPPAIEAGPARPLLRHRRRSRFHPDRRGAHAADHQRAFRGQRRQSIRQVQGQVEASWRPGKTLQPLPRRGRGDC
jgi:hypothetical protein